MACRSCKRCSFSSCGRRRIPVPKRRVDGISQRYWVKVNNWVRKSFPKQDWDKDKVRNELDCEPLNPRWQDIISKFLSKDKERIKFRDEVRSNPVKASEYEKMRFAAWRAKALPFAAKERKDVFAWAKENPGENEELNLDAEHEVKLKIRRDYDEGYVQAKKLARDNLDKSVADLSREDVERELEEIGEVPEEFSEVEARRRLRRHWEGVIDEW